jgi:aminoglycoside phosphotransferase (APT) family kinase protein
VFRQALSQGLKANTGKLMKYGTLDIWIKENYSDIEIEDISSLHKGVVSNTNLITFSNKEKIVLKYSNTYEVGPIRKLRWQYEVQSDISNIFPVPEVFKYCSDRSIIGQPFYIMGYIDGKSKYDFDSVKKSFDLLSELHLLNLSDVVGKKYKKDIRLKEIIEKIYKQYKATEIKNNPDVDYIFIWLKNNIPRERVTCFCHNDWRMSNIIFSDDDNSPSVIDWELSGMNDPRADLGIAMAYWTEELEGGISPISPEPPFNFDHVDKDYFVKKYFEKLGFDLSDWKFFEILGLFRLIRIGKLGESRYNAGIIDSMVYNNVDIKVKILIDKCKKIIGEVDG